MAIPEDVREGLGIGFVRKEGPMDDHFKLSGKLVQLDRLLNDFFKANSKVLLFAFSTEALDLIENYVKSAGFRYSRMDGSTPANKRQILADEFNADASIFLFLLSTKATGVGLNLTVRRFVKQWWCGLFQFSN